MLLAQRLIFSRVKIRQFVLTIMDGKFPGGGGGGGGDTHLKRSKMLVVSLRGIIQGFWIHLWCS